ncbi:hypothetical protein LCGC14_0548510 [marine sediment metagenome]|uniref:Uncharacterized protein n=1 Tax=marine sediment metagenome TaxID=412755 RepID=A0A0F9UBW9_9ZZZZ
MAQQSRQVTKPKKSVEIKEISLPMEPTVDFSSDQPEIIIIAGSPKVGKTFLSASFPKVLIADMEGGSRFLEYHPNKANIYVLQLSDLAEVRGLIVQLAKEKDNLPYDTIVVDSLTTLEQWIEEEVSKDLNCEFGTAGYGADYGSARTKMMRMINGFKKVNKRIILIAHTNISAEPGTEIKTLSLTGKVKNLVTAAADAVGFMGWKNEERIISFASTQKDESGSRYPQLIGKDIPATYQAFAETIGEIEPVISEKLEGEDDNE